VVSATGQFVIELDLHDWAFRRIQSPTSPFWAGQRGSLALYRVCELTDMGGWPPTIGGLSIPYVTIPTKNRAGITMGGTRYFMLSSLLEKRLRVVVCTALQFTEEYGRRQGKADEQHYGVQVFLSSRIGRLSTRRGGVLVHWQEPCQSPGNSQIVGSW
jgi:hypothetical protein